MSIIIVYFESFSHFFRHDSLQKHGQIPTLDAAAGRTPGRKNKAALLQAFEPQNQTVAIPVKHLDHAAPAIDEDEKGARKGVCPQLRTDDTAQAVKGLAHIAGTPV